MADIIQQQENKNDSTGTQIGTQNNYYGLTPQQAAEVSIKLFYENFPKLQEEAKKIVDQRISDFNNKLFLKLSDSGFDDFRIFSEPGMQYDLYEAQKSYAKNGEPDLLSLLITTIEERCNAKEHTLLKITISEALGILPKLLPKHLRMLTMIFMHNTKFDIDSIDSLREYIISLRSICNVTDFNFNDNMHLIQLGVAREIGSFNDLYAEIFEKYKQLFSIAPVERKGLTKLGLNGEDIMVFNSAYQTLDLKTYLLAEIPEIKDVFDIFKNPSVRGIGLTHIGKLIAIKNWDIINNTKTDISMWIY